ncbi:MAG: PASTA domain-containing protein [Thermodesulfobacteriota bacterium]
MFLFLIGVATGISLLYREQLNNLVDIWRESFPPESPAGDTIRGTIYDRNFKELAQTLERVSLYVRPREVENFSETAVQLSEILALSESEIMVRLSRDSHLVWLRHDITQDDEEAIAGLDLPGIYFHREFARTYPQQEHASHLIGYSENDQGLTGVEHYYNRLLNQNRVRQEDTPTLDLMGLQQTGGNGHDLVLTLDMKIQAILERYVTGIGEQEDHGRIASLLIDTAEGKIVAGANYPSYNPNNVWQHGSEKLDSLIFSPMVIPEEIRRFFLDASFLQGGWEEATQVYPWSLVASDVNFSRQLRLWERLQFTTNEDVDFSGTRKQHSTIPQFIDCFPGCDYGTVPKTATPLKVLQGVTHLVNGGKKIQPHILDRILERPGQKEYYYDAYHGERRGRNVLPSMVSQEMRQLLQIQGQNGVLGSTTLGGETVSLVLESDWARYAIDGMSLVFIPARQPELILLMVERREQLGPQRAGGHRGKSLTENIDPVIPSMVALQQVSQNLADMLEVEESEERNFKGEGKAKQPRMETLTEMLDKEDLVMPDLTGVSLRKGLRLLQQTGAEVEVRGSGRIISQSPKAGKVVAQDERVLLILKQDTVPETSQQTVPVQGEESVE